jgi:hypothetical protein
LQGIIDLAPEALYALAMSEDTPPVVTPPQPFIFDGAKFSQLYDNLRGSLHDYLDYISASFDKASDLHKQQIAFHERLLLIDMGTIGL